MRNLFLTLATCVAIVLPLFSFSQGCGADIEPVDYCIDQYAEFHINETEDNVQYKWFETATTKTDLGYHNESFVSPEEYPDEHGDVTFYYQKEITEPAGHKTPNANYIQDNINPGEQGPLIFTVNAATDVKVNSIDYITKLNTPLTNLPDNFKIVLTITGGTVDEVVTYYPKKSVLKSIGPANKNIYSIRIPMDDIVLPPGDYEINLGTAVGQTTAELRPARIDLEEIIIPQEPENESDYISIERDATTYLLFGSNETYPPFFDMNITAICDRKAVSASQEMDTTKCCVPLDDYISISAPLENVTLPFSMELTATANPEYYFKWYHEGEEIAGAQGVNERSVGVDQLGKYSVVVVRKEEFIERASCTQTAMYNVVKKGLFASSDLGICAGESTEIWVKGAQEGLTWSPTTGMDDPTSPNPTVSPATTTTYKVTALAHEENLITNGDFSNGLAGFATDYTKYQVPIGGTPGQMNQGTYNIASQVLSDQNEGGRMEWHPCKPKLGNDEVVYMDAHNMANARVVEQTVDVKPGEEYNFTMWAMNIAYADAMVRDKSLPGIAPKFQVYINDIPVGGNFNVNGDVCEWKQHAFNWESGGNTKAKITVVQSGGTDWQGRDFGVSDLSFGILNEQTEYVQVSVEPCNGKDLKLTGPEKELCLGDSALLQAFTKGIIKDWKADYPGEFENKADKNQWVTPPSKGEHTYTVEVAYETNTNLIANGDCDGLVLTTGPTGNTDFPSYNALPSSMGPGSIGVGPYAINDYYVPVPDHTEGGAGNMLIVDGLDQGRVIKWTVNVTAGTQYSFSAWIANINLLLQNPAELQFYVNGQNIGGLNAADDNEWYNFYEIWEANTTGPIDIEIRNDVYVAEGNDFALDDIEFKPLDPDIQTKTVTVTVGDCKPPVNDIEVTLCEETKGSSSVSGLSISAYNDTIRDGELTNPIEWFSDAARTNKIVPTNVTANGPTAVFYARVFTPTKGDWSDATLTYNIISLPDITIPTYDPLCIGLGSLTLSGATPTGGEYLGDNVTNGVFYPNEAGDNPIFYTYTDANGCTDTLEGTVEVAGIPELAFNKPDDICENIETVDVSSFVSPKDGDGGTGKYIESHISSSGIFTHTGADVYTLSYRFENEQGCSDTAETTIEVFDLPEADISPDTNGICINTTITLYGNPVNGGSTYTHSWETTGGTISDDAIVDPTFTSTTTGEFDITYTVVDENGCQGQDEITLLVNGIPEVSINSVDPKCEYEANVQLTVDLEPDGGEGIFSGDAVTVDGEFLMDMANIGDNEVHYEYTDPVGCKNSADLTIVVNPKPDVSLSGEDGICIDADATEITPSITGGTFVHDAVDNTGIFTPSVAGAGDHTIEYLYSDPSTECKDTAFHDITVNPLPVPVISGDSTICSTADAIELTLEPFNASRSTIEGDGVTLTSSGAEFDPSGLSIGNHLLTYTYEDENGCVEDTTFNIRTKFTEEPIAVDGTGLWSIQNGYVVDTLGAIGTIDDDDNEIVWYEDETLNSEITAIRGQTKYETGIEEVGEFTFYIRQYYEGCYSEPVEVKLSIIDCPAPPPVAESWTVCDGEEDGVVLEGQPSDDYQVYGWFSTSKAEDETKIGDGATYTPQNPTIGDNVYYIAFFDEENDCWGPTEKVTLTINPIPDVFVSANLDYCDYDDEFTPNLTPEVGGDLFLDGNKVTIPLDPSEIYDESLITHTLEYTFTDENGCTDQKATILNVHYTPPLNDTMISVMDKYLPDMDDLQVDGTAVKWYDTESKDLILEEGNTYDPNITSTDVTGDHPYTYYLTQTINGCESVVSTFKVHVTDCPTPAPVLSNKEICIYNDIPELLASENVTWPEEYPATGNGIMYWFTSENERNINNAIFTGEQYTPSFTMKAGTNTFYVGEWDYECLSPLAPVTISVIETAPPLVDTSFYCQYDENARLVSSKLNTFWFDDATFPVVEGTSIGEGNFFQYPTDQHGPQTYWASAFENGCYSNKIEKTVHVIRKPDAPVIPQDTTPICEFSLPSHTLEATLTGNKLHWLDKNNNPIPSNTINLGPLEGGVVYEYHVYQDTSNKHCISDTSRVWIDYIREPDMPEIEQPGVYCLGDEIQPVTVTNSWITQNEPTRIEWLDKNDGYLKDGETYTPQNVTEAQTIFFKVVGHNRQCPSDTLIEDLTVYLTPNVSIAGEDKVCVGDREVLYYITDLQYNENDYRYEWMLSSEASSIKFIDPDATVGLNNVRAQWVKSGVDTLYCETTYKNLCTAHDTLVVYISPIPKPKFDVDVFTNSGRIKLTNYTELTPVIEDDFYMEQDNSYIWMFYDQNKEIPDTTYKYQSMEDLEESDYFIQSGFGYGTHFIHLQAINDFGCVGDSITDVFMDMETTLFVPNTFAPDVDQNLGVKEFKPKGSNLQKYEIYIYDVWGNIVWYSNELNENGQPAKGWNGKTLDNVPLKADTYMWKIDATFRNGDTWKGVKNRKNGKYKTMGNVTLIR